MSLDVCDEKGVPRGRMHLEPLCEAVCDEIESLEGEGGAQ